MGEPIAPIDNDLWHPFWQAASEGRLVLPFSLASDRPFWPPSPVSPFVTGGEVEWREVIPEGRLLSRIVYRRGFQKVLADRLPYAVGLVELAGGVRIGVHMPDPDSAGTAVPGDRVAVSFAPLAEQGQPVPMAMRSAVPREPTQ